jgi:acetyl esterase
MKKLLLALMLGMAISLSAQTPDSTALNKYAFKDNIPWASPAGVKLTMDIYTPETGKKNYPVYVIFHGGGWLINNETIMDEMSRYIVQRGEYVVCNVNYRLLTANSNTTNMNQIIEDVMGAVLWIKENIRTYGGDAKRIAVSGDSAGGHLSAMIANASDKLESDGFAGPTLGFNPSYLPKGKTAEQIQKENGLAVQAVILNYPAVDIYASCSPSNSGGGFETSSNMFWQFGQATARGIFGKDINVTSNPDYYKVVSPAYTIPTGRKLPPHLLCVGSKDNLTTPESVKAYADALEKSGNSVEFWIYEGRPHAYLDSGKNDFLGTAFLKDAPQAIDRIMVFLDKTLQKK